MTQRGQGQPKYLAIADDLRARIESGEYPPGSQLPTHAVLTERYDVALNTVRDALGELRRLGLAETFQGSGTFVRAPGHEPSPEFTQIMGRLDGMEAEIRRLTGRIGELEQQHPHGQ